MNQECKGREREHAAGRSTATRLRLHAFLPRSRANGPGWRAVIWTQGCSIRCPGCFNPETHSFEGGELVCVDDLFRRISALAGSIEGITLSGGEPLDQPAPLLALLRRVRRETTLSVVLFTGYTWAALNAIPHVPDLLACVDVLLAGPYQPQSSNAGNDSAGDWKSVHFLTTRYNAADMHAGPDAEAVIMPDGSVVLSGLHPPVDSAKWEAVPPGDSAASGHGSPYQTTPLRVLVPSWQIPACLIRQS
jgi:anaerobic ribonucleoside-triphosphate reductase activating protein